MASERTMGFCMGSGLRLLLSRLAREWVRVRKGYHAPTLGRGEYFVPPLGQESYQYHADNCSVGHLSRYAWACLVFADHKPERILDVACGCGYGSAKLVDALPQGQVLGWDRNRDAIGYAREHYARPNLRFIRADIAVLGKRLRPQTFDAVVSFDTIEHLPEPEEYLRTLARLMKQDAVLLVSIPCWPERRVVANPWHLFEPTYEEMEALVRPHFGLALWGEDLPHVELLHQAEVGRDAVVVRPWSPLYLTQPRRWAGSSRSRL